MPNPVMIEILDKNNKLISLNYYFLHKISLMKIKTVALMLLRI